jgi:RsiW-degrading membrane proteinase PrsW (M82 family)
VLSLVLACALGFAVSGLLVIADGLAGVMASWDTPSPGIGWIRVAIAGHCLLAVVSVVLFGLGTRPSSRHRGVTIMAWLIIPVALGWFLLAGRLAAGS